MQKECKKLHFDLEFYLVKSFEEQIVLVYTSSSTQASLQYVIKW